MAANSQQACESSNNNDHCDQREYVKGINNSFEFRPTDIRQVLKLLNKLNKSKGAGLDKLLSRLIRECADLISPYISIIFNCCFTAPTSYGEFVPSAGRLNGPLAWCSEGDVAGQEFLQIHVPEAEMICAVAIQGTGYERGDEHVKEYYLEYSEDGFNWQVVEKDGELKVLFDFKVLYIFLFCCCCSC